MATPPQYAGGDPASPAVVELVLERPVRAIPVIAGAGSRVLTARRSVFTGWSLLESTGTAGASVELYNGQDATGTKVATIALSAGSADHEALGAGGVYCDAGLYLRVVSGSVTGSIWARV